MTERGAGAFASRRDLSRETLLLQIAWFNRLRLVAVLGVALTATVAEFVLRLLTTIWPIYVLCLALAVVDACYFQAYPRLRSASMPALRRHVDLQIAVDLLLLTGLLAESGGVSNPFILFYLFHPIIASLLLSLGAAVVFASLSLLCVVGLGVCQLWDFLAPVPTRLAVLDLTRVGGLGLTAFLLAFSLTLGASIYFVATVLTRLRRREAELESMTRQLAQSEKLASVGTLAAGVSHEINNPVAVIRNKVQILRYRIGDGDAPEKLTLELEAIEKHTLRIAQITGGLLAFSREAPFELAPLDLNELVEEAVDLVRVPFREKGVPLRMDLDPSRPRVQGSANHLMQVVVNILLNARDASAEGSSVEVATRTAGSRVGLLFTDHGAGIRPEDLPRIFDPFFTTKEVGKGTGLGLAISHGIVERHLGTIEVESEVGSGTVFRIWLPLL